MQVSFLGQPFEAYGQVASILEEHLSDGSDKTFLIASAWAKNSGFSRLRKSLELFRDTGGFSKVIIGIDEGGATEQGLKSAIELFDEVNIFHDQSRRTFHPKVYLIRNTKQACLIVGSNNFTAGGLYDNFEAAMVIYLDLNRKEDEELLKNVLGWFEILIEDDASQELTETTLQVLKSDERYRIGDEKHPSREYLPLDSDRDGISTDAPFRSIFDRVSTPIKPLSRATTERGEKLSASPVDNETGQASSPSGEKSKIWFKKLSRADAQRPKSHKSNPTGNLKLTSAGLDIDRESYFRSDLFGAENWSSETRKGNKVEQTVISFEVYVEGEFYGDQELKIDHALHRISAQKNVPTWLHWGSELGKLLKANCYYGSWVAIRRSEDGTYTLQITSESPQQIP